MTTTTPTLASITFDCADALTVGRFWSAALDRPMPDDASSDYVQLAGEPAWSFMAVPEGTSTESATADGAKGRVHVDLAVGEDRRAAVVERLISLGATKLWDGQEGDETWVTLADPEGNAFCVS
jgi:hypothetical protein